MYWLDVMFSNVHGRKYGPLNSYVGFLSFLEPTAITYV